MVTIQGRVATQGYPYGKLVGCGPMWPPKTYQAELLQKMDIFLFLNTRACQSLLYPFPYLSCKERVFTQNQPYYTLFRRFKC